MKKDTLHKINTPGMNGSVRNGSQKITLNLEVTDLGSIHYLGQFNDDEINNKEDLVRLVGESDIGSLSKVEVWRKNIKLVIEVQLGELPEKSYVKRKISTDQTNEKKFIDLGLSIVPTKNEEGVIVSKVDENLNLLIGDLKIEVNMDKVTTVESFIKLIDEIKNSERRSILLKVMRDEELQWVTLKIKN